AEAEDVLQEVWMRWQRIDRAPVVDPLAVLVTMTTRLAINELQSARVRRESYVGPWVPGRVDTSADATLGAERAEALSLDVRRVLVCHPTSERAAYVLREAFGCDYTEISSVVQVPEGAAGQRVSRARKHLVEERHREVRTGEQRRLLDA